jgi:hypothetical protein
MVCGKEGEFREFLFMSKYIVRWSEPGELSPIQHSRYFEDEINARWFAKEMKKSYNWVICTESKNVME